ncbi:MAG: lipase maturation factor family protein [Acidobacteriota bacterium]
MQERGSEAQASAAKPPPVLAGWQDLARGPAPAPSLLWPRWLFLRALGLIFFSAFYSLAFQIRGLIGEHGILPAGDYLRAVAAAANGIERLRYAPTLLWLRADDAALLALVGVGLAASLALACNLWPRLSGALCMLAFLSAIGALQEFSSYQSDGMLLEAGFAAIFLAPRGAWPGLGAEQPPSQASRFLLRWELFRIYFESGLVKLLSGEPQWRDLTALDRYHENGPLPTWIGWYAQQLPHAFHAACAAFTLLLELVLVWMVWLPRRFRLVFFALATTLQVAILATANYAFLNYLVLALGFLLLDDRLLARLGLRSPAGATRPVARWRRIGLATVTAFVVWASVAAFLPLPPPLDLPHRALAPLRIADSYGLFAVMTRQRYEIEFQGSMDGETWTPYPFRYKPQDPTRPPGIFAPYQPRFDWNLWFASLADWRSAHWVVRTEARLLEGSPAVLGLFAANPFPHRPPRQVRAVRWRYWFTDLPTRRRTGRWWNREELGLYAPVLERRTDGGIQAIAYPAD